MAARGGGIRFDVKHKRKTTRIEMDADALYRDFTRRIEEETGVPVAKQKIRGLGPDAIPGTARLGTLREVRNGRGKPIKVMVMGRAVAQRASKASKDAAHEDKAAELASKVAEAEAALAARMAAAAAAPAPEPAAPASSTPAASDTGSGAASATGKALQVRPGMVTAELTGGLVEASAESSPPTRLSSNQVVLGVELLDAAVRAGLDYPYFFEISVVGPTATYRSVVSVLEFTAENGTAVVPRPLMEKLGVGSMDSPRVWLRSKSLPKATFASLQPLTDAWDTAVAYADQQSVLQDRVQALYQHVAAGDIIGFDYGGTEFAFLVAAVEPSDAPAVSLIDTEVAVDVRPPLSPIAAAGSGMPRFRDAAPSVVRVDMSGEGSASGQLEHDGDSESFVVFVPPDAVLDGRGWKMAVRARGEEGSSGVCDVDLFVSQDRDVPRPSNTAFSWRDVRPGPVAEVTLDVLDVARLDGPLHVTVEAWSGAPLSFELVVEPDVVAGAEASASSDGPTAMMRDCEHCGASVPAASYLTHELRCSRIVRAECSDCAARMPEANLAKHVARIHTPVACSACGWSGSPEALQDHRTSACIHRLVSCVYCEVRVPLHARGEHQGACGARTVECPLCGVRVARKALDRHVMDHTTANE